MVKYFQLWSWDGDKESFKETSDDIGRTQVETFNRMIRVFRDSDEYKELVKLNAKQKKRKVIIALALIVGTMLSYLSMRSSSQELPLASPCSPTEPDCLR